jgi:hypothetical protein
VAKLKEVTRKTTPITFNERVDKIKAIQRGWINYFRLASIQGKLNEMDGWLAEPSSRLPTVFLFFSIIHIKISVHGKDFGMGHVLHLCIFYTYNQYFYMI